VSAWYPSAMAEMRSGYKHWRNSGQSGDVCFVTTTIEEFIPVFAEDEGAQMFLDALRFYRRRGDLLLHAYVVMLEHAHLLLTPLEDRSVSEVMKLLKRYTSRQIMDWCRREHRQWLAAFAARGLVDGDRYSVWQRSFRSVPVVGDQALLDKIAYIHDNPVRRGLVQAATGWRHSSARAYERPDSPDELDFLDSLSATRKGR